MNINTNTKQYATLTTSTYKINYKINAMTTNNTQCNECEFRNDYETCRLCRSK